MTAGPVLSRGTADFRKLPGHRWVGGGGAVDAAAAVAVVLVIDNDDEHSGSVMSHVSTPLSTVNPRRH